MKKLITTLSILFISIYVFAEEKPYTVKTFNASEIENVGVRTSGGGISIFGSNDTKARVEVYVKGNNWKDLSKEEIEKRLQDYELKIALEGNTLVCTAKSKNNSMNWKNGLSISFKVYSPVDVNTDLSTSGGGIKMTNLAGNLKFRTSGGGLDLEDLKGNIKGSTSGGGIDVVNCDQNVDLSTSGGGINARDCDGEIKLNTSGGGIGLKKMSGNINVRTSGGGISVDYLDGDLEASTSGGGINLDHIAGSVKARTSAGSINANIDEIGDFLDLSTTAGGIDIDVPDDKGYNLDLSGNKVNLSGLGSFNGSKSDERMKGSVNGGGARITARASSGRVSVH
jgi:DUF4097 and DUF4098 domain-containing protein YvlB